MEIVKKGKPPDAWYGQCSKCKAILKAEKEELTNIQAGSYRNDNEDFTYQDCMSCGGKITVLFYNESTRSGKRIKELAFFDQQ